MVVVGCDVVDTWRDLRRSGWTKSAFVGDVGMWYDLHDVMARISALLAWVASSPLGSEQLDI